MDSGKVFLNGGRIINPESGLDIVGDILIEDGIITALGKSIPRPEKAREIDCAGKWIIPGIIDLHVHLSEPKRYDRETVKSLTEAAVAGGVTTAIVRPSPDILIDDITVVEFIFSRNRTVGKIRLLPTAAMTVGMEGKRLTEFGDMADAGAVAVGDDGRTVMSSAVMRRALEYARDFDLTAFTFPQDEDLAAGGDMNEGAVSSLIGLKGIPYSAEEVMVTRDIILARMTGANVHVSPVTTAGSIELINRAKNDGINVTCDTSPQYILLDETEVTGYNTNAKVLPPLRRERDIEAVIAGLKDGTIDALASGHEPLSIVDKDTPFAAAEFGISGVELLLPLCFTKLIGMDIVDPNRIIGLLTSGPASIINYDGGRLTENGTADITIIDPDTKRIVAANGLRSRGKNTPFLGSKLTGYPEYVISGGEIVYEA